MNGRKKGGLNDPVAQNIRSQQARDGMPTKEEQRKAQTCDRCDDTKETARLRGVRSYVPSCPGVQSPNPGVFCDECWEQRETKEDAIRRNFSDGNDYVVEYTCGALKTIDMEAEKEEAGEEAHIPHRGWSPEVPLKHDRCGAVIGKVWERDDLLDEDTD